jgi:hypothetical protein
MDYCHVCSPDELDIGYGFANSIIHEDVGAKTAYR